MSTVLQAMSRIGVNHVVAVTDTAANTEMTLGQANTSLNLRVVNDNDSKVYVGQGPSNFAADEENCDAVLGHSERLIAWDPRATHVGMFFATADAEGDVDISLVLGN